MFELERYILKSLKQDPDAWTYGGGAYEIWTYKHRVTVHLAAEDAPWRVSVNGVKLGFWVSKLLKRRFKKFAKEKALRQMLDAMLPKEEEAEQDQRSAGMATRGSIQGGQISGIAIAPPWMQNAVNVFKNELDRRAYVEEQKRKLGLK